jgi:hypothetical protein
MTATTLPSKTNSGSQKFADWAVTAVTIIALLVGWFYKNSVVNRSLPFTSAGITARTPSGWMVTSAQGNEILHVTDPLSTGFGTTYTLENIPVASDATMDQVASMLTLQRGQALTAFRILGQESVIVYNQEAYEIKYVYVESNPNLTHNEIPNIVMGLDYIFLKGDHAVVATYWAEEKAFDSDLGRFHQFLSSLKY